MVSKPQPALPLPPPIHLETIYEETGSSPSSSVNDIHHHHRRRGKSFLPNTNQMISGLISARSIPSVDVHRRRRQQRIFEQQEKPPIEVRNRDGTKRFIHSNLPSNSMIVNRRTHPYSSRHDSSEVTTTNTTLKKKKKPDIVLTIITAEDLTQAGITPPSTTSPDDSETVPLSKSTNNKAVQEISSKQIVQVPMETLPIATILPSIHPVQPIVDISVSNLHFPSAPRHRPQHPMTLRHPQQISNIRSQSLPPSQLPTQQKSAPMNPPPPVAVVPPSPKKTLPSLQITLTNDENDKHRSSQKKQVQSKSSSSRTTSETVNHNEKQSFRPSATVLVGGGSRSAFRPFLKSNHFNTQPRYSSQMTLKPHPSTNSFNPKFSQQQPVLNYVQPYQPMSSSKYLTLPPSMPTMTNPRIHDHQSINSHASNPVRIVSDKKLTNITKQAKPQQSFSISMNNPFLSRSHESLVDEKVPSITLDSNLQWHSVTSKSLYDVPRLSNQYADIPLRITIPEGTPTHNQRLLHKHDTALEQRLLDAGLSPETIALYERILEVADAPPTETNSPPDIIDSYPYRPRL